MTARHGYLLRGFESTPRSPMFEGRFGRMFHFLPPAQYGTTPDQSITNLTKLADAMVSEFDEPKDGPDDEEGGIPALYTYLGQFIDHDLTFDPASSLQKQNDPDALVDFRNPSFDLDNLYGRGPDDQPYMYNADGRTFFQGSALTGGGDANAKDLPRNQSHPARALIGDPRNDENVIVAQLHGLFQRFHNRVATESPGLSFEDVQRRVRFHYQYVVVNDFLSQIIRPDVLAQLKTNDKYDRAKLKFFHWQKLPFMPVEFSAAAYRLGHSMVRPGYRLNDENLLPIFPVAQLSDGLTGFGAPKSTFGIDWGRFIDIDVRNYGTKDNDKDPNNKTRLQLAYRLDTALVRPLSGLPAIVAPNPPPSLAARNLQRGFRLGLPSGQVVARAMGITPLNDEQILIGQAVDTPENPLKSIASIHDAFRNNCPLWTYILAEATRNPDKVTTATKEKQQVTTPKLGPVGGRIVAEVLLGLLFGDRSSYFNLEPTFQPQGNPGYRLKDFVNFALGK